MSDLLWGGIRYIDMHLSQVAQRIHQNYLPNRRGIDVTVIEACALKKLAGGRVGIVPTMSVGNTGNYVAMAPRVIVELNITQPEALYGMHDCACVKYPPYAPAIPLTYPDERIGDAFISCPIEKIAAIVPCASPDKTPAMKGATPEVEAMADNLMTFLRSERQAGRLPSGLLPLQSGVGSVGNSILKKLGRSDFTDLYICSEVLQDGILDLIDAGKVNLATATALTLTQEYQQRFFSNIEHYKKHILLRAQEVTNSPALIRRFGIIAINTAIECDIYGNVNSSHICGSQLMNGIGGSCDFSRNSPLTIFLTTSTAKNGHVSSVVPFCSHVDSTEHDVDVIISDQGIADLRGLSPKERAMEIISAAAHPDYRPCLRDYFLRACKACHDSQTPHILSEAFSMHQRFLETGSMKQPPAQQ